MVSKSSFTSKLTRDPRQKAELYSREGRTQKAAEMYAKAGDFRQAARLAVEAGDERLAVECSLRAAFPASQTQEPPPPPPRPPSTASPRASQPHQSGQPLQPRQPAQPNQSLQPQPPQTLPPLDTLQLLQPLQPLQAAELLASRGHHDLAIGLFELAHAYRRAAASALTLGQAARAARIFERGRSYFEAAVQYESAELLDDALRVLELEAKRLGRDDPGRMEPAAQEQLARVEMRRADVLRKLGKSVEAAALLRQVRPTAQTVRLLEESGKFREAIEAALQLGDAEMAVRLLQRAPDIDRQLAAQTYLRSGHAAEAGNLFASLGMAREAAEAYETGGDWAKAGSRWETAQEYDRAAEAYLKAGRPRDGGRCYAAIGKSQLAAAAYSRGGDHAAAAAQYLKGRQRVAAAAELLAAGDKAQATKMLMQVVDSGPEHEAATLQLVPLLLEQDQAEEALRRLRRLPPVRPGALIAGPDSERAHSARERLYWLGRTYQQLGKLDQAESCFRDIADPVAEHRDALARYVSVRDQLRPATADPRDRLTTAMPGSGAHVSHPGSAPAHRPPTGAGTRLSTDHRSTRATGARPTGTGDTAFPAGADTGTSAAAGASAAASRVIGTLAVGQVLAGRFQIIAEIGQGGMGRVYKAYDSVLGEQVAIKMLIGQPDDGSVDAERLLREVQICRRITHPNVVRVFDLGRHDGWIFIIMELLEGQVLADLIDPAKRPAVAQVRTILTEIASGLQEAHALGVVHRDLKPENVILTATRLKILDFGIARMSGFDKRLTQVGFALGSPLYMSPEQIQGLGIDSRSDLYSLGVLAFALLAGHEPFDGANSTAIAIQHLQQPPPDLRALCPGLPEGWVAVVGKLLAKRPEERYQSAQEVIAALAPLAG